MHVVVTNPHPRLRSTATMVFYYVLYRISLVQDVSPSSKPMSAGGNGSLLLHVRLNDVYLNSLYFLYRFSSATRVRPRVNYRFIFNTLDSETMIRTNIFLKRKLENDCQIDFYFIRNKGEKKMKKEIQTFLRIFPNIFNNRSSCISSYVVQAYLEGALSKELYRKYIGNSCHEQFRSLR